MKPVIAIDQDEVLADLLTDWVSKYNRKFNDNLKVGDIKSWDMTKYVKQECGEQIFDLLDDYNLYRNLDVIEDSQEVVLRLMDDFEVYIVTSATNVSSSLVAKVEWLNEHFEFIPNENIVLCGDKSIVKADYLIDDGLHNLRVFEGTGLLFDSPHNKDTKEEYTRVHNWREVESYFEKIVG